MTPIAKSGIALVSRNQGLKSRLVGLAESVARWLGGRLGGNPREVASGQSYRVMLVGSSGGHLAHLLALSGWWEGHERRWVTFDTADARSALVGEDWVSGHYPTTRNIKNLLRNAVLARRQIRDWRPDVIISTGAGLAVPFFWIGRARGCHTVYLEVYDRVASQTMTGRLVHPVTEMFLVQWPEQKALYEGAIVAGTVW